jgi:hypothetical protein
MDVKIGDVVKWSNGRKPLGVVIQKFYDLNQQYAVVRNGNNAHHPGYGHTYQVVRIYESLIVVK